MTLHRISRRPLAVVPMNPFPCCYINLMRQSDTSRSHRPAPVKSGLLRLCLPQGDRGFSKMVGL
jgi:hypothetical protein